MEIEPVVGVRDKRTGGWRTMLAVEVVQEDGGLFSAQFHATVDGKPLAGRIAHAPADHLLRFMHDAGTTITEAAEADRAAATIAMVLS